MIEILLANKLNDITTNNYPIKLPEKAIKPALVYTAINKNKHKHLDKSKHYTLTFQVNVFADSYKQAKLLQQQVEDVFDECNAVETINKQEYTLQSYVVNVIDLFSLNTNQIAIDIQVEYMIG
ncbi:hypothetical protein [Vibrio parahaemolyticus]|uniref:hypothetical protein n=1 Tax=Vibrio parahaemolyticus TaxID=670 RepID=UPI0003FA7F33|nr:hypothetical protein [Vibrio parahaemolyticus]HCH6231675.1 hypothetical protein [Vibrio parahaemolyticus]HCM1461403.1 hypothetical protein [Vibrio parahaemolyticus]HCM1465538.1 hypothetical protein [Vibrio parahaemolyticus]